MVRRKREEKEYGRSERSRCFICYQEEKSSRKSRQNRNEEKKMSRKKSRNGSGDPALEEEPDAESQTGRRQTPGRRRGQTGKARGRRSRSQG